MRPARFVRSYRVLESRESEPGPQGSATIVRVVLSVDVDVAAIARQLRAGASSAQSGVPLANPTGRTAIASPVVATDVQPIRGTSWISVLCGPGVFGFGANPDLATADCRSILAANAARQEDAQRNAAPATAPGVTNLWLQVESERPAFVHRLIAYLRQGNWADGIRVVRAEGPRATVWIASRRPLAEVIAACESPAGQLPFRVSVLGPPQSDWARIALRANGVM
jgi:hypothetical protein